MEGAAASAAPTSTSRLGQSPREIRADCRNDTQNDTIADMLEFQVLGWSPAVAAARRELRPDDGR